MLRALLRHHWLTLHRWAGLAPGPLAAFGHCAPFTTITALRGLALAGPGLRGVCTTP